MIRNAIVILLLLGSAAFASAQANGIALSRGGETPPIRFEVPAPGGEVVLQLTASTDADWGVEGRESAVLEVLVGGRPRADIILFVGPERLHTYRTLLGRFGPGEHEVVLRFSAAKSSPETSRAAIRRVSFETVCPGDLRYAAFANAPYLHTRPDAYRSDVPLLLYSESWRQGGGTRIEYTVVYSNEDSRAGPVGLADLLAKWGHASDIEFIYGVRLDGRGRPVAASYQDRHHRTVAFKGKRLFGDHPEMWVVTRNGLFGDRPPGDKVAHPRLAVFLPPDDTMPHPPDRAREAFMAAHPWTYEIVAKELARERFASGKPKTERPTDPRTLAPGSLRDFTHIEIEADGYSPGASLVFAVVLKNGAEYRSDHGLPFISGINTARFAQTMVELPPATKPADIAAVRAICRRGSVVLRQVKRVFLLGPKFEVLDVAEPWRGEVRLGACRPQATFRIENGRLVPVEDSEFSGERKVR